MFTFLIVLIIIVSILLILVVLVQNSKGGGLAAGLQSTNQIIGVRQTADFIEKATWVLAISLSVLVILTGMIKTSGSERESSKIKTQMETASPDKMPEFPSSVPDNNQAQPVGE